MRPWLDVGTAAATYDDAVSRAVDLGRRLVALRWSLFDAAVALLLVSATAELADREAVGWWAFASLMVAGLLIRRRQPVLAVVLAGVGAVGHHLGSAVGAGAA